MNDETKPIGSYVNVSNGSLWGKKVLIMEYPWENKVTLGENVEERIKKGETPIYDDTFYVSGCGSEDKSDYAVYRGRELLGTFTEDYEPNGLNYYSWNGKPCSRKEFYSKFNEEKIKDEKHF